MARRTLKDCEAEITQLREQLETCRIERRQARLQVLACEQKGPGLTAGDLVRLAFEVLPPDELDAINLETLTANDIIQAARKAREKATAILEATLTTAGAFGLECSHRDTVEVLASLRKKTEDLAGEVEELQDSRVEPETVKDLLAEVGLNTYPLTQYRIGDPMLALALRVAR